MATQVQASTNGVDTTAVTADDIAWQRSTQTRLMNLSTSDAEILKMFQEAQTGDRASDANRQWLQTWMQRRSQLSTTLTNILQSLHEAAMAIIRNFRN